MIDGAAAILSSTSSCTHTPTIIPVLSSPSPFLTACLDRILLLSPRTWYGILISQTKNPFNGLDRTLLPQAIIGTVLPVLILSLLYRMVMMGANKQSSSSSLSLSLSVLLTTRLVPWTLSTARTALHQLCEVGNLLRLFHDGRNQAFPSAMETLQE